MAGNANGRELNIFRVLVPRNRSFGEAANLPALPVDGYPAAGQMRPADLQNENFAQFRGPRALIANVATLTSLEPQL
jgi:hypothetical protein